MKCLRWLIIKKENVLERLIYYILMFRQNLICYLQVMMSRSSCRHCHFIKMLMLSKRHFLFYFSKLQGVLQHVKVISLSLRKYWHFLNIMSRLSNCHFKKIGRFLQCQGHLVYVFLFNGNVITCHFKQIAYFENVQLVHCQIWHSPISFPVIFYEVHRNCQGHLQSFV